MVEKANMAGMVRVASLAGASPAAAGALEAELVVVAIAVVLRAQPGDRVIFLRKYAG